MYTVLPSFAAGVSVFQEADGRYNMVPLLFQPLTFLASRIDSAAFPASYFSGCLADTWLSWLAVVCVSSLWTFLSSPGNSKASLSGLRA